MTDQLPGVGGTRAMPSLGFRRISRSLLGDKGGEGGFWAKEQPAKAWGNKTA